MLGKTNELDDKMKSLELNLIIDGSFIIFEVFLILRFFCMGLQYIRYFQQDYEMKTGKIVFAFFLAIAFHFAERCNDLILRPYTEFKHFQLIDSGDEDKISDTRLIYLSNIVK